MMPPIDPSTGYLPPGVHDAAWALVLTQFGSNAHRLIPHSPDDAAIMTASDPGLV